MKVLWSIPSSKGRDFVLAGHEIVSGPSRDRTEVISDPSGSWRSPEISWDSVRLRGPFYGMLFIHSKEYISYFIWSISYFIWSILSCGPSVDLSVSLSH